MDDTEGLVENPQPEILAQIPGVELANDQDNDRDSIEVLEYSEEEEAFEASKNSGLEPDTPAEMSGVDSAVDLVEVVEDPHSTVEHNIDHGEANDEIRDRI